MTWLWMSFVRKILIFNVSAVRNIWGIFLKVKEVCTVWSHGLLIFQGLELVILISQRFLQASLYTQRKDAETCWNANQTKNLLFLLSNASKFMNSVDGKLDSFKVVISWIIPYLMEHRDFIQFIQAIYSHFVEGKVQNFLWIDLTVKILSLQTTQSKEFMNFNWGTFDLT
jgi:hypothetical protein